MSTLTTVGFDHWVRVPATWGAYKRLLKARGERGQPRYTFVDGRLTIVTKSHTHEWIKLRIGGLIEDILVDLLIDFHPSGEVTLFKSSGSRAGNEADQSYYLTNIARIRRKKNLVMGRDPAPDLAVEVVISHPEDDALEAYRRFGVREVWVCKEAELEFLVLGADGQYVASPTSVLLPFLASVELAEWLFRDDFASEPQFRHAFRAWVAGTLGPRHHPESEN
jgi:Uma2 family endonuclease